MVSMALAFSTTTSRMSKAGIFGFGLWCLFFFRHFFGREGRKSTHICLCEHHARAGHIDVRAGTQTFEHNHHRKGHDAVLSVREPFLPHHGA